MVAKTIPAGLVTRSCRLHERLIQTLTSSSELFTRPKLTLHFCVNACTAVWDSLTIFPKTRGARRVMASFVMSEPASSVRLDDVRMNLR